MLESQLDHNHQRISLKRKPLKLHIESVVLETQLLLYPTFLLELSYSRTAEVSEPLHNVLINVKIIPFAFGCPSAVLFDPLFLSGETQRF